jgi:hypothetical protein
VIHATAYEGEPLSRRVTIAGNTLCGQDVEGAAFVSDAASARAPKVIPA